MSSLVVPSQSGFRRALNLFFIVVVAWDLINRYARGSAPAWAVVCIIVAEAAWLAFSFLPVPVFHARTVALVVMILGGGIAATATDGVGIVPVIVALIWLARDLRRPTWFAIVCAIVAGGTLLLGDVLVPIAWLGLVSIEAGIVVAFLGGLSRRQFLLAERQSRQLLDEQARANSLDVRQQLAHDIHDVLAHSLGGLVIQLDAVDALLEAGDTQGAAARVRDSRALAAEGLSEARRAVAALGETPVAAVSTGDELGESLAALLAAHRSFGGEVDYRETGARSRLSGTLATALRRAMQEALTNARKHAPGAPVEARLEWKSDSVQLTVSNPMPANRTDATGGRHGLVGMRERFAALPGGLATAGEESGSFVVRVEGHTNGHTNDDASGQAGGPAA